MIKRIWHGYTTPERADEYEALLKAEVIKGIEGKNIPGFWGIDVLRRPLEDEVEFITIMDFASLDSVKAFVGEDYEAAYVPDEARAILSRFDERSQHYEVRDQRQLRRCRVSVRTRCQSTRCRSQVTAAAAARGAAVEAWRLVRPQGPGQRLHSGDARGLQESPRSSCSACLAGAWSRLRWS